MGAVVTKNNKTKSNIRRQVIIKGDTKVTVGSIMGLSIIFPKDKTCSKSFEFVSLAIDNKHMKHSSGKGNSTASIPMKIR